MPGIQVLTQQAKVKQGGQVIRVNYMVPLIQRFMGKVMVLEIKELEPEHQETGKEAQEMAFLMISEEEVHKN